MWYDLVQSVQCKKREKHPLEEVTFLKVTHHQGCFSHFLNCANVTIFSQNQILAEVYLGP